MSVFDRECFLAEDDQIVPQTSSNMSRQPLQPTPKQTTSSTITSTHHQSSASKWKGNYTIDIHIPPEVTLVVDSRERHVLPHINAVILPVKRSAIAKSRVGRYQTKTVKTGDYLIYYRGELVLNIERKAVPDLAGSITGKKDRYHSQKDRLMVQRRSGVQILYILEGELAGLDGTDDNMICNLHPNVYRGFLANTSIRDGIPIIHTSCIAETLKTIDRICHCVADNGDTILENIHDYDAYLKWKSAREQSATHNDGTSSDDDDESKDEGSDDDENCGDEKCDVAGQNDCAEAK